MRILFVDPDHGPRSQMAAALLARKVGPSIEVGSAGTQPTGSMARVAAALDEVGVGNFAATRTSLSDVGHPPDILITVCEEGCAACPYLPGSGLVLRWPFPDPSGTQGNERDHLLRRIRDELIPLVDALAGEVS